MKRARSSAVFRCDAWRPGGAIVLGLGTGLNSPTLYAWTSDLSDEQRRGRAVATRYVAPEAGIGLGALAAGCIFANQVLRPP